MTRLNLPAYSRLCWADLSQVDCDYQLVVPRKLISTFVIYHTPELAALVKNFALTEMEQENILARIVYDNLTIPEAVCEWLHASEPMWQAWIVSYTLVEAGRSSARSMSSTIMTITVSVAAPVLAMLLVVIAWVVYLRKSHKRRELSLAPGGMVALVFTDIQV